MAARGIASDGTRRVFDGPHNIKPYPLATRWRGKIDVTDPDSRNLKNARVGAGPQRPSVVTLDQIVIAAAVVSAEKSRRPTPADGTT